MVTLSFLPESLSPILNSESPKRSHNLCNNVILNNYGLRRRKYIPATYLDLPFLVSLPGIGHASDNARSVTSLVSLDKLFHCQVIHSDPLNGVREHLWVVYLEQIVLLLPVAIRAPLAQEQVRSVL